MAQGRFFPFPFVEAALHSSVIIVQGVTKKQRNIDILLLLCFSLWAALCEMNAFLTPCRIMFDVQVWYVRVLPRLLAPMISL